MTHKNTLLPSRIAAFAKCAILPLLLAVCAPLAAQMDPGQWANDLYLVREVGDKRMLFLDEKIASATRSPFVMRSQLLQMPLVFPFQSSTFRNRTGTTTLFTY